MTPETLKLLTEINNHLDKIDSTLSFWSRILGALLVLSIILSIMVAIFDIEVK